MLSPGQEVMIIGDSRCNPGRLVTVAEVLMCDLDHGCVGIYRVEPRQELNGKEILFQRQHLLPIDDAEVTTPGGLIDLELPA